MKMAPFVAGLLATSLFVSSFECRAAPRAGFQGAGIRSSFAGRPFGTALREGFGRGTPRVFTRNQNGFAPASSYPNRSFARGPRFFSHRNGFFYPGGFAFGAFGLPWWYPCDKGDFDEDPSFGVATVNGTSQGNDLAVATQAELVQPPYFQIPGPAGGVIRAGGDRSFESAERPSGPTRAGQPQAAVLEPGEPAGPQASRATPVASPVARTQAGAFDRFILLSWHEEDGKATVLVENTETNAMQEITSKPNDENFRVVTIRPSANPKLSEVVISNGLEQRVVRFRPDPPLVRTSPE